MYIDLFIWALYSISHTSWCVGFHGAAVIEASISVILASLKTYGYGFAASGGDISKSIGKIAMTSVTVSILVLNPHFAWWFG